MIRRRLLPWILIVAAACSIDKPLQPPAESLTPPAVSIVDGSAPGGLEGFYFRPPLSAGKPAGTGEFDASLLDLLAVEICEWNGSACVGAPVRRLTSQDPPPSGLRVVQGAGFYEALWKTGQDQLDPAKTYRIRVLASGGELGHADVDIVDNTSQGDKNDPNHVIVVNGSTLPIGFRVEEGVGERVGSAGGTVTLAAGDVKITLPPGALPNDVFLTAAPATNLPPNGPPVIPGTAWDFGPDGIVFNTPVTMTIAYDPANLPPGVVEAELRIHKLVNGAFVQQNAGAVDVVNNTVSAEVDGFSVYLPLTRQFPGSTQDIRPPVVQAIDLFDPSSNSYTPTLSIDASAADVSVRTRISMTDNISGVGGSQAYFVYRSPSGKSRRFVCWLFGSSLTPTSGSDTNGQWVCDSNWPRYSEAGTWTLWFLHLEDKIGNFINYGITANGVCGGSGVTLHCIPNPAQIVVTSNPTDTNEPTLLSLDVGINTLPRVYGPSVSVDASTAARPLVFRFHATDDLSGVGTPQPLHDEYFQWQLVGPSGQTLDFYFAPTCTALTGTPLDGTWECPITIPRFAEVGTWRVRLLFLPDRVGNGGRSGASVFFLNGAGQLCNARGNCVPSPTVQVIGGGDAEPPTLQSLSIVTFGTSVIMTAGVTDNISGAIQVTYFLNHTSVSQQQLCGAQRTAGTSTNGTWSCTLNFSQFAALGQWKVEVQVRDGAGNVRHYSRRASDGFLCYPPVGGGAQVCQNFGSTDIIIQ